MTQATLFPAHDQPREGVLYLADGFGYRVATDEEVRCAALGILARSVSTGPLFTAPNEVKDFLRLKLGHLGHEVFAVMFLDAQHRLLAYKEMFRGTLTQTSVYPREVVVEALGLNAAAIICAHNHPSGSPDPSRADEYLTKALKSALQLVDVRVLDHLVVGGTQVVSFAERGLM